MSKDTHGFSVSVACEVGVFGAIILQHLCFLQKNSISADEVWQEKWIRRSARAMTVAYPYWTGKQIRTILDNLESGGFVTSKIENENKYDRSKSYILTEKGLNLLGEKWEIAFSEKANECAETENVDFPNGEMNNKVGYTSFVPSFVEKKGAAPFSFSSENENQTLEAEKEKTPPQSSAPPPPLAPPFVKTGEIEPLPPTRYVRLYDPQEPEITLVEPAPIEYQRPPRETPPNELHRVNIVEEIEAMRNDPLALEGFVIGRKLPRERFKEYLSDFEAEQIGLKTEYKNERELRLHFLNWSGVRHQIAQKQKAQTNGKQGSHITQAGGDLSVYQKEQIF